MHTPRTYLLLAACGLSLGLLGGCASVMRLDNEVQSYAHWPAQQVPAAGDRYRFERLPSQQQSSAAQDELERLAQEALAQVGLLRQDGKNTPPWTVQVSARSAKFPRAPWDDPRDAWPYWHGYVMMGRGVAVSGPLFPMTRPPYYRREVSLVLRRSGSSEVVYETQASQDGPWPDSPKLWGALLEAALQGFPQPTQGKRQVVIEVPR